MPETNGLFNRSKGRSELLKRGFRWSSFTLSADETFPELLVWTVGALIFNFYFFTPFSCPTLHRKKKHNDWTDWVAAPVMHAHNQHQQRLDLHRSQHRENTGRKKGGREKYHDSKMQPHSRCEGLDNLLTTPRLWRQRAHALTPYLFSFLSSLYFSVCRVAMTNGTKGLLCLLFQ